MKFSKSFALSIVCAAILAGCGGDDGKNGTNGVDGANGTNGVDGTNGVSVFVTTSDVVNTNAQHAYAVYSDSLIAAKALKEQLEVFVAAPTDENFTRIRIRKLLKNLQKEGLDDKKLNLTIQNLKKSNNAIEYYAKKNVEDNLTFQINKKKAFLSKDFLNQPKY